MIRINRNWYEIIELIHCNWFGIGCFWLVDAKKGGEFRNRVRCLGSSAAGAWANTTPSKAFRTSGASVNSVKQPEGGAALRSTMTITAVPIARKRPLRSRRPTADTASASASAGLRLKRFHPFLFNQIFSYSSFFFF